MKALFGAAVIALAAAWVYGPSLRGGWLWDDGLEVTANPVLRDAGGWWRPWVHPEGMDYFPMKSSLQWAQWRLWGPSPAGYRAVNLALHAAGALLLWRLLAEMGLRGGFLAGLLFAVHPLAVESVAWISEFKNTASLPPLLLSCIGFVRWERTGSRGAWIFSLVLFVAALACKTSVAPLPAVLLIYLWWKRGHVGRRGLVAAAPFFAAAAALGAATVWFQSHRSIGIAGTPEGLAGRAAQAGWSLLCYAAAAVWPFGTEPVYPRAPAGVPVILPWILMAAAFGIFWGFRRDWGRHAILGSGWFFLNLVPVLGLVPMAYYRISPRADHFEYVSLAGAAALAGAALAAACRRRPRLAPAWALGVAAVAGVLGFTSRSYAAAFMDETSLWTLAAARNPSSWLAHNNLGKALYGSGDVAAAEPQFAQAAGLQPDSPEAHANLANCLEAEGRRADAEREYAAALAVDPRFAGAHYNLGLLLLKAGRRSEAAAQFQAALETDPRHPGARNSLGLCLAMEGRLPEAILQYQLALAADPVLPEAHLNLGNALFRTGRAEQAAAQYRLALQERPGYAGAHHNLGLALQKLGRPAEAREQFSEEAAR